MRLELRDLTAGYAPGEPAVSGLDLEVKEGERMAVLGPSGSGKTTTLRLIAGLMTPDRGDVLFDDESVLDVPCERRGAAMVFQQDTLFPFRSVAENVGFGLRLRRVSGSERRERIAASLASVHLTGFEDRWPDELSGGQRQRVALARALVVRPRILLLDEPFNGVERGLREELAELVGEIQRAEGITTILVTHDQREAAAVGDRVAVLIDGRLRQVGSPRELYHRPVDLDVARFFGADNVLPGTKAGADVHTAVGMLHLDDTSAPDGPVLVNVRPDLIELADVDTDAGDERPNELSGEMERSTFVGVAIDCTVSVNGVELRVLAPPATHPPAPGEPVVVRMPPAHVQVLPATTTTAATKG